MKKYKKNLKCAKNGRLAINQIVYHMQAIQKVNE